MNACHRLAIAIAGLGLLCWVVLLVMPWLYRRAERALDRADLEVRKP